MPIQLLVACQDLDWALALSAQIVQAAEGGIAGEATQIGDLLRKAAVTPPDVLLLEYSPAHRELAAWHLLPMLRKLSEKTQVLLLCASCTYSSVVLFIQLCASGYLLKSSEPSLFAKAVHAVHAGQTWFSRAELLQALRGQLAGNFLLVSSAHSGDESLTPREREILALIGQALSNKEIARELQISEHTVKTHLHRIYVKLHKSGRYKAFRSRPLGPDRHGAHG